MNPPSRTRLRFALAAVVVAGLALPPRARAQETVDVVVPASVSFSVTDVAVSTPGSPDPATLQLSSIQLQSGNAVRVGVKAEAASFTPPAPGGSTIAASSVSWTTSGAQNGAGSSGTLDSAAYGQVFQSTAGAGSAQVDVHWTLAVIGGGVRSGAHDLTIRWKIESVIP